MKDLSFTHINIKPIVRGRKYVAEFTANSGLLKNAEITIGGNTPGECLEKTEKFLDIKLTDKDYTIHK